jgi:uncharacterized protein
VNLTPSAVVERNRDDIRRIVLSHRATNPRVFGSVLRGDDTVESDLDLLVDPVPGTTLLDLGGIQVDLEALLGVPVDVVTPGDLPRKFRDRVLQEAMAV